MLEPNKLRFAGEININAANLFSLNGTKLNIANQILSIEIYEDMFAPFMTANIVVAESIDILNLFPLIGEEYIEIDVMTPQSLASIKNIFYIYKVSDRIYTSDREVTYSFKCVSKEFVTDSNIKLRKTFKGSIEDSVKSIMKSEGLDTKKSIVTESTTSKNTFTANFWSPVKCLNYLATNAISSTQSPSFLFFENRNGLNFVSVNSLLLGDVFQKFNKDNYTRDNTADESSLSSIKNVMKDYSRILDLNIPTITDYMKAVQAGQFASKVISHDILTKRYKVKDYSLLEDKNLFNLLNNRLIHSSRSLMDNSSLISVIPRYYNNFMGYSDVTTYRGHQRRLAFFSNLKKNTIQITVFGRTDYTVGLVVDVTIPSVKEITEADLSTKDKMLSGKYIITAISHKIDRENHQCTLELMKNSVIN